MVRDRYTAEDKNLVLASDGIIYIGNPFVDGSWRGIRVDNDWHMQRRESGTWVEKSVLSATNTFETGQFLTSLSGGGDPTNVAFALGGSTPLGTGFYRSGATSFGIAAGNNAILVATTTGMTISVDVDLEDENLTTTGQIIANNVFGVQVDRQGESGNGSLSDAAMIIRAGEEGGASGGDAALFFSSSDGGADVDDARLFKEASGQFSISTKGSGSYVKGFIMNNTTAAVTIPVQLTAGGSANGMIVNSTGDVTFTGTGGLIFAEIFAFDLNQTITISASGIANKVQITVFDTDGASNNMTPDHTNDHITVDVEGVYKCDVTLTLNSLAGAAAQFGFGVFKNNGATHFTNLHIHRDLPAGAGGNSGAVAMTGLIDLAVNDTIEVFVWNETNTQNVVVDDITMNLVQIGGT